ncbi:MAG: minor capsid protein [Methanobrevibacter sp.]|nr:minor capsid protein [Methanobrevibacter sp.]
MTFLSKKKEKWLLSRAKLYKGVFVGGSIGKNASADAFYRNAIDKELKNFITSLYSDLESVYGVLQVSNASKPQKASISRVLAILNTYKGAKLRIFLKNADKIIHKWLKKASQSTDESIRKVLFEMSGKEISINYNRAYDDILRLIIDRNVQLITNTTSQTLTNIENIVFDGMTTGGGWGEIEKTLKEQKEISRNRVRRIARDQTAKANEALSELTQRENGVKFFMWRTMGDERVRERHRPLDGKIYKWGDVEERLPIIDKLKGKVIHGYPAQAVNCRCIALPVWILKGYTAEWSDSEKCYKVEKGGYV